MTKRTSRNHTPALQGESGAWPRSRARGRLAELAQQFDVRSNQITQWKGQLLEVSAAGVFGHGRDRGRASAG